MSLGIPLLVIFTLSAHKPGHNMICAPLSKMFGHPWHKFACESNDHIITRCGCSCTCDMIPTYGHCRSYSRCNAVSLLLQSLLNTERQCSFGRCLREIADSNLGWDAGYLDWGFRGFLCPFNQIRRQYREIRHDRFLLHPLSFFFLLPGAVCCIWAPDSLYK